MASSPVWLHPVVGTKSASYSGHPGWRWSWFGGRVDVALLARDRPHQGLGIGSGRDSCPDRRRSAAPETGGLLKIGSLSYWSFLALIGLAPFTKTSSVSPGSSRTAPVSRTGRWISRSPVVVTPPNSAPVGRLVLTVGSDFRGVADHAEMRCPVLGSAAANQTDAPQLSMIVLAMFGV